MAARDPGQPADLVLRVRVCVPPRPPARAVRAHDGLPRARTMSPQSPRDWWHDGTGRGGSTLRSVRRRCVLSLLLLAVGSSCLPLPVGFPVTPVLPSANRPGLFFDAADVPAIAARLGRPPYSNWGTRCSRTRTRLRPGRPVCLARKSRAPGPSGRFAYAVAGNAAHLAAARSALLSVGTGPDKLIDDMGLNLGPTSRTVLTASSHLQAVAQGYDMLRTYLPRPISPRSRRASRARPTTSRTGQRGRSDITIRVNNWRTKACWRSVRTRSPCPLRPWGPSAAPR